MAVPHISPFVVVSDRYMGMEEDDKTDLKIVKYFLDKEKNKIPDKKVNNDIIVKKGDIAFTVLQASGKCHKTGKLPKRQKRN